MSGELESQIRNSTAASVAKRVCDVPGSNSNRCQVTAEQLEQVKRIAYTSKNHAETCQRLIAAGLAEDVGEADELLYELDNALSR